MLAIRLHIKKNPKLNKGCYLIPIFNWDEDKQKVKDWVKTLEQSPRCPNHKINYITLVSIPDDFPVYIAQDWADKMIYTMLGQELTFAPLSEQREFVKEIAEDHWLQELVLGEALPKKNIKWTKDYRLWRKGKKKKIKSV
jgi:hypothetical protein